MDTAAVFMAESSSNFFHKNGSSFRVAEKGGFQARYSMIYWNDGGRSFSPHSLLERM